MIIRKVAIILVEVAKLKRKLAQTYLLLILILIPINEWKKKLIQENIKRMQVIPEKRTKLCELILFIAIGDLLGMLWPRRQGKKVLWSCKYIGHHFHCHIVTQNTREAKRRKTQVQSTIHTHTHTSKHIHPLKMKRKKIIWHMEIIFFLIIISIVHKN